jgi:broad specificity phosphatase PhoE
LPDRLKLLSRAGVYGAGMGAPIDPSLAIYLSRHGETKFNRENRFCGDADSPLTATGIAEARRNGRALRAHLANRETLRMVSSPLRRALHTADIIRKEIGREDLPIETDARLREISFGAWEGLTLDEIKARDAAAWAARVADRWHVPAPGGESYAAVTDRVRAWLREQRDGPLLVVTHGAVDRILRGLYAGLSPEEICALPEPQDELFLMTGGRISTI